MSPRYFLFNDKERQAIWPKGKNLNILFNLDPYCTRIRPWISSRLKVGFQLLSSLQKAEYFKVNYRFFGSTNVTDEFADYDDPKNHLITLTQKELLQCFDYSFRKAYREVFLNSPQETPKEYADICARALDNFVPDVIFGYGPTNYLRHLYPQSAVIHFDAGFLSRAPYPSFIWLDPLGLIGEGVLGKYWDEIKSIDYSDEEIEFAHWIWTDMFIKPQNKQNPLATVLPKILRPDRKLFLIATQITEYYNFYGCCDYDDQIHFINDALSELPEDCQIIITMHPRNKQKLRAYVTELAAEDARIIDEDQIYDTPMTTQSILPFCDGAVCISSSVGIQAKMWGVPLACPGESHLTKMCDTRDISRLHECDTSLDGKRARRDEIAAYVYFAAGRQSVHEADWYTPEHLVDIVINWLDCAARNTDPLAYFDRLGNRDFQKAKETIVNNLVDLTPERLETWRLAEKGLLKQNEKGRRASTSIWRRLASKVKHLAR